MFIISPVARSYFFRRYAMFLFGGNTNSSAIQKFDGTTRTTETATYTGASANSCAAGTPTASFIFSNSINRYNGETSSVDAASLVTGETSAGASSIGSDAYVFGGVPTSGGIRSSVIQKYDGASVTSVSNLGAAVSGAVCAYSSSMGVVGIFGGVNASPTAIDTIQTFNGSTISNAGFLQSPSNRVNSAASSITGQSAIWLFGGNFYASNAIVTISKYTSSAFSNEATSLPNAITTAGCTQNGSNAYIFGGNSGGTPYSTIQKWTGTTRSTESATIAVADSLLKATYSTYPSLGYL